MEIAVRQPLWIDVVRINLPSIFQKSKRFSFTLSTRVDRPMSE